MIWRNNVRVPLVHAAGQYSSSPILTSLHINSAPTRRRLASILVRSQRTLRRPLIATVALLTVAACNNDDSITGIATSQNAARTHSVFGLTGTPAGVPAAYYFVTESLVRPQVLTTGGVNFELAFDVADDGTVSLLPARTVVPEAPLAPPSVGIQKSATPFAAITRAPDRGYARDSIVTVQAGETFLLQLYGSGCTFGEPFYAKVSIDSVIVTERRIVFTSMVNRNCGFRGLVPGLPTN